MPVRLTSRTADQSSSFISSNGLSRVIPAQVTSALTGPRSSSTRCTKGSNAAASETSTHSASTETPYSLASREVSSAASGRDA